jgi:tetratricopeptide (TPR) repeat protein
MTLNNLGAIQMELRDFTKAEDNLMEALKIREQLAELNESTYVPSIASDNYNLALLYVRQGNLVAAKPYIEESVRIYRQILPHNPTNYGDQLARSLIVMIDTSPLDMLHRCSLNQEIVKVAASQTIKQAATEQLTTCK